MTTITIDTTTATADDIVTALQQLNAAHQQAVAEQQQEDADLRTQIDAAISQLTTLLGTEDAPPGADSIRAILAADDATIATNSVLAIRLAFVGLQQLTSTTRDIARVVSRLN